MKRAALALLLLAACSKTEGAKSKESPPTPPPQPPHEQLPAISASPAFVVAEGATVVSQAPLRWERDGHLWEAATDPRQPRDLGERKAMSSTVFDADAWYTSACTSNCEIDHGQKHTLTRIDRRDGTRRDLVQDDPFESLRVVGDHLMWMHVPYGPAGDVRRIHHDGGIVDSLWKTDAPMNGFVVVPGGVLAWTARSVAWIPDAEPAQVLATGLGQVRAAAVDADHIYIADGGDPYGKTPDGGRILRVSRKGGAPQPVAAHLRQPSGVAVDKDNVYWIVEDQPEVYAALKSGGPTRAIALPRVGGAARCGRSVALIASASPPGLYVQRAGLGSDCPSSISFVPTTP